MQISKRLMNGMVLMYQGIAIVNYNDQYDDNKNTLGLKYWYCMNGKSSQPDIRNKFPRCESTAGNEDGHNDDEVNAHTHGTTGSDSENHRHSIVSAGSHQHASFSQAITFSAGTRGDYWAGRLRPTNSWNTTYDGNHRHWFTSVDGSHTHTLNNPSGGGGTSGKNMPKYSGLQFIRRSR